jgi:hypothetical protein
MPIDRHKIGPYTASGLRRGRTCDVGGCGGRVLSAEGAEDKLRSLRLLTMVCHGDRPYLPARDGAGTSAPGGLCPRPAPGGPLRATTALGLVSLHGELLLSITHTRSYQREWRRERVVDSRA